MSLSDFVNILITTENGAVTQAGFGTPLIFDYHTRWTSELVREYTSPSGMVADGFTSSDAAYKAASACFAQGLSKVKIGRRTTGSTQTLRLTPTAVNAATYSVKVTAPSGTTATATYTSDGTATVAEITAGLTSAINGLAIGVTAADATTHVTVTAVANTFYGVVPTAGQIKFEDLTAAASLGSQLDAIALEDPAFYGVVSTSKGSAEIAAVAAWAEANEKLYAYATQDTDAKGAPTTDILSTLKTSSYARSFGLFSLSEIEHGDAAFLGKVLYYDPGSATAKFKELAGVSTTSLTASEFANIKNKNGNYYISQNGRNITGEGVVASGLFIDVVRDRDWFKARLQEAVFSLLVRLAKVPMTDAGIALVEAELRGVCEQAVRAGVITADYDVIVPKASAVSSINRGLRLLPDCFVNVLLAGAVHTVGPVTVTVRI